MRAGSKDLKPILKPRHFDATCYVCERAMIEFKGGKTEIKSLSLAHNLPWSTIKNRYIRGYRDDKLVVERIHDTSFKGVPTTLAQIAKDHGLPLSLIKGRHAIGLRDDALVAEHHLGAGNERSATKLDVKKVSEIKRLLWVTDLTQREIAEMYNIDQSHVSDIKRGKRWAKVKIDLETILAEET